MLIDQSYCIIVWITNRCNSEGAQLHISLFLSLFSIFVLNKLKNNYSVYIDEVEGVYRRIIDEAEGRVCNPTISPRHRGYK